jgi:SAM-dependent methyltransferase
MTDSGSPTPASEGSEHAARQRRFYESRAHRALQPHEGDYYVHKLASTLAVAVGIESHHRLLEVGAGFGRFTFALLEWCESVTVLDLSEQALGTVERERKARGIASDRIRSIRADLDAVSLEELGAAYDQVVGFFVLHHLEDVGASIGRLAQFVAPGGAIGFIEPNRWNPLYAAQVSCCPDMTWSEEKGVWRLSSRAVEDHFRQAGLEAQPVERFGFFPPQLINRFAWARRLETALERQRWLAPVLPFLSLSARAPAPADDPGR